MIANVLDLRGATQTRLFPVGQNLFEKMRVLLLLGRGINQTWIGRCILWFEFLDRFKIGCVGDDLSKFLDLIELVQLGLCFVSESCAHDYSSVWLHLNRTPQTKDRQLKLARQ